MNNEHKVAGGERKAKLTPAFVGVRGVAEILGIGERRVHQLRAEGLLPEPVALGPRALRWSVAELIAHVTARAPRGGQREPEHLKARREATQAKGARP